MAIANQTTSANLDVLLEAVTKAGKAIPPVWPLASSVAVNPFLGQTGEPLAMTAARMDRVAGLSVTMPREWYHAKVSSGDISRGDLAEALAVNGGSTGLDVTGLIEAAGRPRPAPRAVPTVAELASDVSGIDWPGFISDRFGAWAAGYFDGGQALWAASRGRSAYAAWREAAIHDLSAEIAGLRGFAAFVHDAPDVRDGAIALAGDTLGLKPAALETYFHQLLCGLGGWAQYARYQVWQAELAGRQDHILSDLLAIRLLWEASLFKQYEAEINAVWQASLEDHARPVTPSQDDLIDAVLQTAAERAAQRDLVETIQQQQPATRTGRPTLQAAFCIDVRSEVFRRALEGTDPGIETIGFAGFFGLAASHRGFASDVEELRLPVLLNPGVTSVSGSARDEPTDKAARLTARAKRAWGRFKLAAVSSFAFVEAAGPLYAGELVRDSLALDRRKPANDPQPTFSPELDISARAGAAETVLRAMSLTENFARVVLLAGHGATVKNNPHASALNCGACGGYSGEVNARLLASLLNESDVRGALADTGIVIPEDTFFVAGLHDTTTDEVMLYDVDDAPRDLAPDLKAVREWLSLAGRITRGERALRLPLAESGEELTQRSRDWSQVRPEWALAGCNAFIAAPRSRTAGKSLEGRAFLHDYSWQDDNGFGVLELIMTAPVVVASWISLQYYGSSVAPEAFGAGNKLLHNVTGGIGVVEGNGGVLRPGLPWQSVHDGEKLVHDPLRLTVLIEAPLEAMTAVLRKHDGVRDLFDNGWLHLLAIGDDGSVHARYAGDLQWEELSGATQAAA